MPFKKGERPSTTARKNALARQGAMVKTTKKGAYAPARKKAMVNRRAPMVETKSRTHSDLVHTYGDPITNPLDIQYIVNDDAFTDFPLTSYLSMDQGFLEEQMIGNSCFVKYLKAKFEFNMPQGKDTIDFPAEVYLIHGFVTAPSALTNSTVPQAQTLTRTGWSQLVHKIIIDYFDDDTDKLLFMPKIRTNIKILGKRKLRANRNNQVGEQPDLATDSGSIAPINMTCNWPMMKKIHYEQGQPATNGAGKHDQFMYPNSSWRPFVILYNPDYAKFAAKGATCQIQVRRNDATYFTDS